MSTWPKFQIPIKYGLMWFLAPQYLHFGVLKFAFNNRRVDLVGGIPTILKNDGVRQWEG